MSNVFVKKIDLKLADKLLKGLISQDFSISKPQYTRFQGKKKGIVCTLYESGKLMVQGKGMAEFVEYYLEPEILQDFAFSYPELGIDQTARIGIDESGKGDVFGPLCIAGVYAAEDQVLDLKKMGVKDSKLLKDDDIRKIASKICKHCRYHVVRIGPAKYNELYSKFQNLNRLLAWGHATAIQELAKVSHCDNVIIDQFAAEWVVEKALANKDVKVNLTQRTKGEEDIVVAAASIVARAAFVQGMQSLKEKWGMEIPKGASARVVEAGKQFIARHGADQLPQVAKMHFRTIEQMRS